MKKFLAVILSAAMCFGALTACAKPAEDTTEKTEVTDMAEVEPVNINMAVLKGPTGIGAAKLINDSTAGETFNTYNFTVCAAPDEAMAGIISGEFDVAAVASNLAPTIYNKTEGKIQIAALNTLGILYVVENGDTIKSIEDLNGVDVVSSGQGSTVEYATNFILETASVTPASIEYRTEHGELAAELAAGTVKVGIVPEPHLTSVLMNNPDARVALNLTEEWDKAVKGTEYEGSALTMGCIVVNKEFAANNKAAFDKFLEEYKASIEFVNSNVADASAMVEAAGIMPKAAVAAKAIPNCNIVYIDGEEMVSTVEPFFNILFNANPKSVGGALPDEEFYYAK
ncbi:MAG: ABC transporter substrate-binding protein [Lachnospiraceae bacterium]|nr:ABC transporter substrate-binding protein [Lachnospiraceae bacterium]